ncbi:hypothetical protein [Pseudomonas sp.]|nr:hypothetical protein [Pseudomonas sp.]
MDERNPQQRMSMIDLKIQDRDLLLKHEDIWVLVVSIYFGVVFNH